MGLTLLLGFCTIVGAIVISFFLWTILKETWRAARNAHRIASVHARLQGYRKPLRKSLPRAFWDDFFSSYDEKIIGCYVIPHNPNHRIRLYH